MANSKLKLCKHCGKEIAKSAKKCPHCGGKNSGIVGPIVGILFILFLAVGLFGGGDGSNAANSSDPIPPKYEVMEINTIEGDFGIGYVVGSVVNNTDKDTNYDQVIVNCLDADGAVIGSAIDNINCIKAGQTWKFKAMIIDCDLEDVVSVELAEITGF